MSNRSRVVDPERLAELKRLVAEGGHSWAEIGARLGCSKHAVSGMVRRHVYGIEHGYRNPALVGVERQVGVRKERRRIAEAKAAVPVVVAPPPVITPVEICQWPMGRRRPWRFCEQPAEPGLPYCAAHCQRAYVPHPRHQVAA